MMDLKYDKEFLGTAKDTSGAIPKLLKDGYWPLMCFMVRVQPNGQAEFQVITPSSFKKYKEGITRFGMSLLEDYIKEQSNGIS